MRADHKKIKRKLNIAKGQIEGIINMIDEDRYCLDIYDQISATRSILFKVSSEIIEEHFRTCVKEALLKGDESLIEEAFKSMERFK